MQRSPCWIFSPGSLLWNPISTLGHPYLSEPYPSGPTAVTHLPERPSAWLGADLILRRHLGQPDTTPEALREYRIAEFLNVMRGNEAHFGPHFATVTETPLLDAYEIVRHQSGGQP